MTIVCDDDGKFQINHWPPLPVEDSVAILQIIEVKINKILLSLIEHFHLTFRNPHLLWKKFSIEPFSHDVSADLKFVIKLNNRKILYFKFTILGIKRNNSLNNNC